MINVSRKVIKETDLLVMIELKATPEWTLFSRDAARLAASSSIPSTSTSLSSSSSSVSELKSSELKLGSRSRLAWTKGGSVELVNLRWEVTDLLKNFRLTHSLAW